jgi:NAD(P)-dependent dehydrogenase (short-subunit alcohol dehydrogenase family)
VKENQTMRLHNEVALVTGGSRGIGRAIALKFAREGARLVITGRTRVTLAEVEKEIQALGREVLALTSDVADDAQVRAMVRDAEARFGRIDVLVNNAGRFGPMVPLHEMPDAEWEETLRSNLTSVFYVSRAVLPGMIARRRGSIIMMSSISAKQAYPYAASYSAAKAALLGLTRALAAEAGPHGIRVNALCPGIVTGTDMHAIVGAEVAKMTGAPPEKRDAAARSSALLRQLVDPEAVADATLFLASAESALMTGQALNLDGGARFD